MSSSGAGTAVARERIAEFVYQAPGSGGASNGKEAASAAFGYGTGQDGNSPGPSQEELTRLISEARACGLREGESQARQGFDEKLAEQQKLICDALLSFQQERAMYYSKAEEQLVQLALSIARKILHREAQVDRMVVAGLVKVMLERMQQGTKAVVRIRPEEAFTWRHYFNTNPDVEVIEDPKVEPGACKIETELGIADMGLEAQLKEVEHGFFDLLAQRPATQ